jgi:hypothetical protein
MLRDGWAMAQADATFEAFRRKLADAVTIAINSGVPVSSHDYVGCCCPIGCLPGNRARPPAQQVANSAGAPLWGLNAFMGAFDKGIDSGCVYSALGLAYRKRFP